jgi:putative hydrolase of HD superfamily
MTSFEDRIIHLFSQIHPLDRVARAGYVMRGVTEPESVAAHSHFVSVLTLLVVEEQPDQFDKGKALALALTHDLCEAQLMDIPMPAADAHLREAKDEAELAITGELLDGFDVSYRQYQQEFNDASSPEARLVRGLDKVQMMLKIINYEKEHRGNLEQFWKNPNNFKDFGIEIVSNLFDAICTHAGRDRPTA